MCLSVCLWTSFWLQLGLLCSNFKNLGFFSPVEILCEVFYLQQFTSFSCTCWCYFIEFLQCVNCSFSLAFSCIFLIRCLPVTFLSEFYLNHLCALETEEFGSIIPFRREQLPVVAVSAVERVFTNAVLGIAPPPRCLRFTPRTPISVNRRHLFKSLYTKIDPDSCNAF